MGEEKYPYNRLKAIWCHFFEHNWLAYDFDVDMKTGKTTHTDKCLRCNKEKTFTVRQGVEA